MNKRIKIAGVPFDSVKYNDVLTSVEAYIRAEKKVYITTPNPEMILTSNKNDKFNDVLNNAVLSIPDGIGVLWASYYLNLPKKHNTLFRVCQLIRSLSSVIISPKKIRSEFPQRVSGSDLLYKIVEESQKNKWRIYLLGADVGVAKKAIDNLLKKYPNAVFAGSYSGSPHVSEEDKIINMINLATPDILFVAYGSPAQEFWITRNLNKLNTVKVSIGVGGAFDFASGKIKRAPKIIQKFGLEWFWRLLLEPKRIKRIWNATFVFSKLIYKIKNK